MGDAVDLVQHRRDHLVVRPVGFEQRLTHRPAAEQHGTLVKTAASLLGCFAVRDMQRLARERKAVGMQAGARDPDQHIAGGNA